MTLDLEKFIANSIKMQAKIQHLNINTKTVKKIPMSVQSLIIDEYGENYLEDADYVSFFWGSITKEDIKKLFNVVDRALGKSANKLTETDFKKIDFNKDSDDTEDYENDAEDTVEDNEVDVEDDEDKDIEDTEDVEVDVGVNDDDDDDDDDDEEINEDDEDVVVPSKTNYFFLKITLK